MHIEFKGNKDLAQQWYGYARRQLVSLKQFMAQQKLSVFSRYIPLMSLGVIITVGSCFGVDTISIEATGGSNLNVVFLVYNDSSGGTYINKIAAFQFTADKLIPVSIAGASPDLYKQENCEIYTTFTGGGLSGGFIYSNTLHQNEDYTKFKGLQEYHTVDQEVLSSTRSTGYGVPSVGSGGLSFAIWGFRNTYVNEAFSKSSALEFDTNYDYWAYDTYIDYASSPCDFIFASSRHNCIDHPTDTSKVIKTLEAWWSNVDNKYFCRWHDGDIGTWTNGTMHDPAIWQGTFPANLKIYAVYGVDKFIWAHPALDGAGNPIDENIVNGDADNYTAHQHKVWGDMPLLYVDDIWVSAINTGREDILDEVGTFVADEFLIVTTRTTQRTRSIDTVSTAIVTDYDNISGSMDSFVMFVYSDALHYDQDYDNYVHQNLMNPMDYVSITTNIEVTGNAYYTWLAYRMNGGAITCSKIATTSYTQKVTTFDSVYGMDPPTHTVTTDPYLNSGQRAFHVSCKAVPGYLFYAYSLFNYTGTVEEINHVQHADESNWTFSSRHLGIIDLEAGTHKRYTLDDEQLGMYADITKFDVKRAACLGYAEFKA